MARTIARIPRLAAAATVRLTKLTLLAALVAGIPYGLLTQIGSPLPRHPPTPDELGGLLTTPVSETLVLALLADALWILWAAFTISVGAELVAAIRGTPAPRLPTVAPIQALAGWLITGVTVGTLVSAPLTTGVPFDPPPAAAAPVGSQPSGQTYDRMFQAGNATVTVAPAAATTNEMIVLVGSQRHSVTVARGDNLSHLARDWLGDANRWPEIYQLNAGRSFPDVGGRLTNPNLIYPGWVLDLPADARPPGPAASQPTNPAPGTASPSPPHEPAPSQPSRTPAPGSTSPSAPPAGPGRSSSPADPDGVIGQPGTHRSTSPQPPTPSPSGSSASDSPTAHDEQHDDGVDLPGGWITLPLAVALTTAAALVWLRRRHRWVPEPLDAETDDHDLQPPPPVVTRIRRTVRTKNPSLLPPAEPASQLGSAGQAPAAEVGDDAPMVLPPIGPSGVELAGLDGTVPAGGLGLTGPGAQAAARALLVATLSAGGPGDPDACGHVVIPADALTTMLGTQAVDLTGIPRLTVAASLPDALARIEEILIERRRILLDHGVEDLDGIRAADPYYPPMPPILLIAETPPPLVAARVASTLQLGTALQISGILLGGWQGANLTISADGHSGNSGDTGGPRLSVLDLPTTMDLLGVLREAHTGQPFNDAPRDEDPAATDVFTGPPVDEGEPSPATSELTEPARAASTRATGNSPKTIPEPLAGATTNPGDDPPSEAGGENEPTEDSSTVGPVVVTEPDHRLRARVRVLGPPSICDPRGNPIPAVRHHAQQLLVYLVVFRPGAERARICRAFWPAAEQRLAGGSLNTEASELRRYIRQAIGDSSVNPIINPGGRYILNPDTVNVDAWTLVDALQEAKNAPTPETRITALRRAVEAHTGVLADGCDYDWITESRERMRRRGIRARLSLADLIAESEPERAADLLRTAANLDPYSDDLARRALRAYARVGNVEAIRRQLHQLRTALEEINEQPTDETTHLASALVRQLTGPEKRPSRRDTSYDTE